MKSGSKFIAALEAKLLKLGGLIVQPASPSPDASALAESPCQTHPSSELLSFERNRGTQRGMLAKLVDFFKQPGKLVQAVPLLLTLITFTVFLLVRKRKLLKRVLGSLLRLWLRLSNGGLLKGN